MNEPLTSNPMVQLLRDWIKACPNPPEWHWTFDLHVRTVNLLGSIPTGNETCERRASSQGLTEGLTKSNVKKPGSSARPIGGPPPPRPTTQKASAEPGERRETGWLIEDGGHTPRYRTMMDGNFAWTYNANEAIRFSRRVDAEMVSREDEDAWHTVEHQWITLDGEQASEALCPHGMSLAENICGPCSKGEPNAQKANLVPEPVLCSDCPPIGYPTHKTRCVKCPRLAQNGNPQA